MKTLLRLALATLLTVALTEVGIRGYRTAIGQVPPHPDPSRAAEWSWAREHLEAGKPTLGRWARHDPQLGWVTFRKHRSASGGPEKFGERRTPGIPRVVIVGDSFTRELDALEHPYAPDRVFQPDWEIMNLAVQGYGAGQTWLRYREDGVAYDGDVAIFGFYLRDYFRTFRSFRSYAKPTFSLGPGGELEVGDVPVPSPEALFEAYRSGERRIGRPGRSWVLDFLAWRRATPRSGDEIRDERFAVFGAILESFAEAARGHGACPLLVIFPTRPERYSGTVYERIDRRTRETARALGLPFVALADSLYADATREQQAGVFEQGRGAHLSTLGKQSVYRTLDAAFGAFDPNGCFATTADGSVSIAGSRG